LIALRDALRRREIYVHGGNRWRNPDDDLPGDFDTAREVHYAALRQPLDPTEFVTDLRKRMSDAVARLDGALVDGTAGVTITSRRGDPWILVPRLEALPEPANLGRIKDEVIRRWGTLDLLDVLKDSDYLAEFTSEFTSVAYREVIDRATLRRRLLLCLFALGTNMGIRAIVATGEHGESEAALRHVRRHFITRDNLRRAIVKLVNATFEARDPNWWGTGTACASDSKKFGSWESNLMTEWHQRYGGPEVMIYWHVERRSTCIYSQLKSCSSSEVAAMIEGLLRHCTDAEIESNYVDTHGASVAGFAFTELLGFRLLPRLKNIGVIRLYRPDDAATYAQLSSVLTRPVRWGVDNPAVRPDGQIRYRASPGHRRVRVDPAPVHPPADPSTRPIKGSKNSAAQCTQSSPANTWPHPNYAAKSTAACKWLSTGTPATQSFTTERPATSPDRTASTPKSPSSRFTCCNPPLSTSIPFSCKRFWKIRSSMI
jgi:hypothetical protein